MNTPLTRTVNEIRDKRAATSARAANLKLKAELHKVELPPGWIISPASASTTFRPRDSTTPALKVLHDSYSQYRIEIDHRVRGKMKTRVETFSDVNLVCAFVQDWLDYLRKNQKEAA